MMSLFAQMEAPKQIERVNKPLEETYNEYANSRCDLRE
jgi:hypothetical protein